MANVIPPRQEVTKDNAGKLADVCVLFNDRCPLRILNTVQRKDDFE
jgi:hypothetical protein